AELLELDALRLDDHLELAHGVEQLVVTTHELVAMEIERVGDAVGRSGEEPIRGAHEAEPLAEPVERGEAPERPNHPDALIRHESPPSRYVPVARPADTPHRPSRHLARRPRRAPGRAGPLRAHSRAAHPSRDR